MTEWSWLAMASVAMGWKGPFVLFVWWAGRAVRLRRRRRSLLAEEVDDLAALLIIGLGASHTLAGALDAAAPRLGGAVGEAVSDLLRRARLRGLASALAETEGPLAPLTSQLARAQLTGAPMVDAVTAFLQTRRGAVRAAVMESARTLPVRLVVPVALLLLPGFVVLLMGPFVIEQLSAMLGSSRP